MKKAILISLVLLAFVIVGCGKQDAGTEITGKVVAEICSDTDGGNNINEKGTVNGKLTDSCAAGLLIEYYCEDNKAANLNQRCPNKCVDGACV